MADEQTSDIDEKKAILEKRKKAARRFRAVFAAVVLMLMFLKISLLFVAHNRIRCCECKRPTTLLSERYIDLPYRNINQEIYNDETEAKTKLPGTPRQIWDIEITYSDINPDPVEVNSLSDEDEFLQRKRL